MPGALCAASCADLEKLRNNFRRAAGERPGALTDEGMDALMIEVHDSPEQAKSDGNQALTPEMFAEIKLQMDERGNAPQQTDVVTLNADLLEVVTEDGRYIASVRFSGMIRESQGAPAESLDEIWNLCKPVDGSKGWVIAGIQQVK